MVRILVLIGLGCVALSGCATLKDGRYEMAQSCNAQWAWYRAKPPCKDKAYPRHFRSGWKEGYKNVALGGGGLVPPVPPQKYWSARYETCEGRQMISSWYGGYQIGAIEAEKRGEDNCHPVPTACMVALPENGCPCNESTAMSQAPYNSHVSSQAPHAEFLEPSPVAETTTIPVVSEPMVSAPSAPERIEPIEPIQPEAATQETSPIQEIPPAANELPDPKAEQAKPVSEPQAFANVIDKQEIDQQEIIDKQEIDQQKSTKQTTVSILAKPLLAEKTTVETKPSSKSQPTSVSPPAAARRTADEKILPTQDEPHGASCELVERSEVPLLPDAMPDTSELQFTPHRIATDKLSSAARLNPPKASAPLTAIANAQRTNKTSCKVVFKRARNIKDLRQILLLATEEDSRKDTNRQCSELRIIDSPQVAPLVRIDGFTRKESKTQVR